jgi:hypothetical protein
MIKDGLMPRPKAVYGRRLWEVRAVDIASDLLDGGYTTKTGEGEVYEFAMKYRKPKHVIRIRGRTVSTDSTSGVARARRRCGS